MNLKIANEESIAEGAEIIRRGGLVAMPTETVYGLGANALDPVAAARIYEAKRRPSFDPLIVHIADFEMLAKVVKTVNARAQALAEQFWPGPLTMIFPKSDLIPDLITSDLPTVAVRMPAHPVARALIKAADLPIAAPSANPFGYLSPTTAQHVAEQLGERVDLILDGGSCEVGVESTIVRVDLEEPILLRPGGLAREELEKICGPLKVYEDESKIPQAPGLLPSHYAPHKKLFLATRQELEKLANKENFAYLGFRRDQPLTGFAVTEYLSESGDFKQAAAQLFSLLHQLDATSVECIYAEILPEEDLGLAIMNRLRKAAYHG